MAKKIVFTGGLSCGKTTMINILRSLNYEVVEECSERLINNYRREHGNYPWDNDDNILDFHEEVFFEQLKNQENAGDELTFFDRSLIDRLAFLEFDNIPVPKKFLDIATSIKYDKIFFFEGKPEIYQTTEHRPHGITDSAKIEELIRKYYKSLGYEIEIIPFCSREERLEMILEKIC